jgi:FAS-associated factor 2
MASSGVDIEQLSASQREVLEQYTAVTNQELQEALPLLQRSQWNVQVSLQSCCWLEDD